MKKRFLFLMMAVVVLAAGVVLGYLMATAPAEGTDKPDWQLMIEQKVMPLVTTVVTAIASYYIMNYPSISKINAAAAAAAASAAGFDGAAGGITGVANEAKALKGVIDDLIKRVEAMEAKSDQRYEEERKMLLSGLKMIGLGFSHEEERVKNGTAREIREMEAASDGET